MSNKIAEWLIAILAAILLAYLLVDRVGLPVWMAVVVGLGLIVLGFIGEKKKP